MTKIKKIFNSLLPGIFLFGFTVGTGSVTAMAKAGADYGMSLLWTIFLSCLITFILINLFGKYTLVTGETAIASIKKHIHHSKNPSSIIWRGSLLEERHSSNTDKRIKECDQGNQEK